MSDIKRACVIGWPIKHSRSPLIHGYWIKQHGLNADYRREEVPPDQFEAFIKSLPAHGYVGANITIPHKEAALAASEPDDCGSTTAGSVRPTPTSKASSTTSMRPFPIGTATMARRWCSALAVPPAPSSTV
jgi:hypothetical protein